MNKFIWYRVSGFWTFQVRFRVFLGGHYEACYNSRGHAKSMYEVVSLVGDCHDCIAILNLFSLALKSATSLFKMLLKYRPEDKAAKKERLLNKAKAEAEGKTLETKKPIVVKYGINHVTYLIEQVI